MSLFGTSSRNSSKNIVQFRAGKMNLKGTTVTADKRKGQVYVHQADDSLVHFCWKDRTTGTVEDDLIIFPDDCELKPVPQCTTGRVYILKFKSSNRKMFFWMQEPKSDKDEEYCKKVNDALNNPPQPGQPSAADLSSLESIGQGGLQDLFNNMDQQQLLQLMSAGGGMGSLLNPGGRVSSQRTRNPTTRNASTPRTEAASTPVTTTSNTTTTTSAPAQQQPAVQLSQLQNILSQMGVPATQGKPPIDLSEVITPETMIPILADPKVQERLKPFLPQGETLKSTEEELRETVHSPSFRQAMASFSSALASGQLGPLLAQFGLPEAAQVAAGKGDVEAFAKAMQENAKKSEETKDEDMSID